MALRHKAAFLLVFPVVLGGCNAVMTPDNRDPVADGQGYQAQYRALATREQAATPSVQINAAQCRPARGDGAPLNRGNLPALRAEALSPGDMVDIRVETDKTFSGRYVVSQDGTLKLPFLDPITAEGRPVGAVEADLAQALIGKQFYTRRPQISVRVTDMATISVAVSGAVFEPRLVRLGRPPEQTADTTRAEALGDTAGARDLSYAVRAAGGVRPDADLSSVELRRAGKVYRLDLRDMARGAYPHEIPLQNGDEITVISRGCFQDDLMRPGPVSPSGVNLFLSNLVQPTPGNAPAAIGKEAREVPYGTRFIQAVIGTNCVGGTRAVNAGRAAVLVSRNPLTGNSTVVQRDIETILARGDRDDFDPYLLPGDSIACYDSTATNLADVARVLGIASIAGLVLP